jgi:apolipoprotein D and lipocalin family protein
MKIKSFLRVILMLLITGCTGIPDGVQAVRNFHADRYLGVWYEIARLDHAFERGLNNVSATYTLRKDGGIDVLNRGYDVKKGKWKEARGKAYFIGSKDEGRLKVSFFGPFYGAYNIIALDQNKYRYALVCGPDRSYLWILGREKLLDKTTLDELVNLADRLGFNTEDLIYVRHN